MNKASMCTRASVCLGGVASVVRHGLASAMVVALVACSGGGGGGGPSPGPDFTITAQPADVHVEDGARATFSVAVTGEAALEWQRKSPGADWADVGTQASYVVDAVHVADSGTQYRVRVTATAHPTHVVYSSAVMLTVDAVVIAPAVVEQPAAVAIVDSQSATFSVTASGSSVAYQWQSSADGVAWTDIVGATDPSVTLLAPTLADDGTQVRVVLSNSAGRATSAAALLTVRPTPAAPHFVVVPAAVTVVAGQSATFTAQALGTPAPTLSWQTSTDGQNWVAVASDGSGTLSLPIGSTSQDGLLVRALATNASGSVNSAGVRVSVTAAPVAPTIQSAPQDTEVSAGSSASFAVVASGNPAVGYQWQVSVDGGVQYTNVNGATASGYQTPALAIGDDGKRYRVIVSNAVGSLPSAAALLRVVSVPTITRDPVAAAWRPGATPGFFMVAAAGGDLRYQWQVQVGGAWSDYAGATSANFVLPASANAGITAARALVSNLAGSRTSAVATLTANPWTLVSGGPTASRLHAIAWGDNDVVLATGLGSAIVRSVDKGAHWSLVNDFPAPSDAASGIELKGIALRGQAGVAVGDAGTIWRSPDAGAHWVQVSFQSSASAWRGVAFSGGAATAVGDNGLISRSTDGGATWTPAVTDDNVDRLYGVAFNANGVGIAVGTSGAVLRSVDNGASWMRVRTSFENLGSVAFASTSTVVAADLDGRILRSVDAGLTWTQVSNLIINGVSPSQGSLTFDGAGHGVLTLDRPGTLDAIWLTSSDAGATWSPNGGTYKSDAVAFSPDGSVLAAAGAQGWLQTSTDLGMTVVDRTSGHHEVFWDIAHGSNSLIVAVGEKGAILRSTDAGRTWAPPTSTPATRPYLTSVAFASPTVAVAATSDGTVWRTVDSGQTWAEIDVLNGREYLQQVLFTSATHGILTGMFAHDFYLTDDAGATWQPQPLVPTGINWFRMAFSSPLVGVEVGASAARTTTDGGATWTLGSVPAESTLVCVAMLDANTVFASGQDDAVRSLDGGHSYTTQGDRLTDASGIGRMAFANANDGLLTTFVGTKVGRTHDGGLTVDFKHWLVLGDMPRGLDITPAGVGFIATISGNLYRNASY
jgi:photosystem II stability/assembly factor-like uncharacterized protein